MKRKLTIAVGLNTLFPTVDGINKALEEPSKTNAEAAGRKPQGVAKNSYNFGTIRGGGIKKGFKYVGESEHRVLCVPIVVVYKILGYCIVMCNYMCIATLKPIKLFFQSTYTILSYLIYFYAI
jgi:hypothetical protein